MTAGGFIAYFGDRLGYVMGKRRVTLFGLRPRHTATTLTVIAGIVIGGLTLAFLIVVNQAFRFALLKGEEEIRTNIHLRQSNKHLTVEAKEDQIAAVEAENAASVAEAEALEAQQVLFSARQQLAAKKMALLSLTTELTAERTQLASVQAQVAVETVRAQKASLSAFKYLQERRAGQLVYRDKGELGRVVIASNESESQIRDDLVRFLNHLSQVAMAEGAAVGSNGRAVVVATIELLDPRPQNAGDFVDENGSLDALAASIHSYSNGSVVVIASALGNTFDGHQAIVILRPYANVLAIRGGTQIAQTEIPGQMTGVNQIAGELQKFLVTEVRPAAMRAGVIPVRDPHSGSVELGSISLQQIFDIVNEIRQVNGPATVSASAENNVYSADQLKLSFTVSPGSTNGN